MMNIKMIWFYTALAACLGSGYGAGVAMSPSQNDLAEALRKLQVASLSNCETTDADKVYKIVPFRNSKPKTYTID